MEKTEERQLVGTIESELLKLATDGTQQSSLNGKLLQESFARLVALLALGPEPQTRLCPNCGRVGMKAATICGYCWKKTPQA